MIHTERRQGSVTRNDATKAGPHDVRWKPVEPEAIGLPLERCQHGRVGRTAAQRDPLWRARRTRPHRLANQRDAINRSKRLDRRLSTQWTCEERQYERAPKA